MEFRHRLKQLRQQNNLSQEELGKLVGLQKAAIYKYENGILVNPKRDLIEKIASIFGVTPSFLMSWDNNEDMTPDYCRQYPYIPDSVAAGVPCTIEGVKELPTIALSDTIMGKYAGKKDIIIMKVNGESMNKIIPSGSFVAVATDVSVKNLRDGDLVVFGKEHEYSLKHFYDADDKIIFKPNSTDINFTDQVYPKDKNFQIVGKVVLSIKTYE